MSAAANSGSHMKVKVFVRDGKVEETVVDMDRLPQAGEVLDLPHCGRVTVVSSLKTQASLEYEALVIATEPEP
jgi:hypothetical protein